MGVEAREDKLDELKDHYYKGLNNTIESIKSEQIKDNIAKMVSEMHHSGVLFFNSFERTLDEYSLPEINVSKDVINRKVEDTVNMIETILSHWKTVYALSDKYALNRPKPSQTAYASIQRVIKKFRPEIVKDVEKEFSELELPLYGFKNTRTHSGWAKRSLSIQLKIGIPLLIITGVLIFLVPNLNGTQYLFLRVIMALAITLIGATTIEGTINVDWTMKTSLTVRATGWIAIFILLYFFNPPTAP